MMKISQIAGIALGSVLTLYGLAGITSVNPGEVGILIKMLGDKKGMQDQTLDTGMHWVDPFIYDVATYDARFKQYEMLDTTAETKDGQPVDIDISFEIGLIDDEVPQLHETVGPNWYQEVVYPRERDAIRTAVSSQVSAKVYTSEGREMIKRAIDDKLSSLKEMGIIVSSNVRNLQFLNEKFVATLERKSIAAEQEEIQRREAKAAEQEAIKVANKAEGQKQKTIKEAEATREQMRLQGEGQRVQKEEQAKGILAIKKAEAEGQRLLVNAYGEMGAEAVVGIAWAENLGPNVKVYGVPTGAPGTSSIVDVNGVVNGAFGRINSTKK